MTDVRTEVGRQEKLEEIINYWFCYLDGVREHIIKEHEDKLFDSGADIVVKILKSFEELGPSDEDLIKAHEEMRAGKLPGVKS